MSREDWDEIKTTGCGFFSDFETFDTFMGLLNCHRRFFSFNPEVLSNQVYWTGITKPDGQAMAAKLAGRGCWA